MHPISTLVSEDYTLYELLYERYEGNLPLYILFTNDNNKDLYSPTYWLIPKSIICQLANYSLESRKFELLLLNVCHPRETVALGNEKRFISLEEKKAMDEAAFTSDKNLQEFLKKAPEGAYLKKIILPPKASQLQRMGLSYEAASNAVSNIIIENIGKHMLPMEGLCTSSQTMISPEKIFIDSQEVDLEKYKGPIPKKLQNA